MKGKKKKIGFIGAGNMAEALIKGLISSGMFTSENISVSDVARDRRKHFETEYKVGSSAGNRELAKASDIIVLAVKPGHISKVVQDIKPQINTKKIIISIAAGVKTSSISRILKKKAKIVRVMPNTPALIMAGASVLYCSEALGEEESEFVRHLFESVGIAHIVEDEELLDAVTGLSGSGPAFVSVFIEALADGGVKMGLPRELSQTLAAHTVYGTARMITEAGIKPADLKDKVSSPGGTTIEGVHRLEHAGFRSATISAVEGATRRSKELSREDK